MIMAHHLFSESDYPIYVCNMQHMTERLPSHNFDWFALLEIGFVPADIWISWFGPFAFVKPNLSHLRVLELECWISPETSFVFSMSNHPHFRTCDIHICQSSLYGWLQSASSKSGSHPLKWGKSNWGWTPAAARLLLSSDNQTC